MEYWKNGELTETINNKINNCTNLEQLFNYWIQVQKNIKTEIDCLKNTGYFVKDGYIDEEEYNCSNKRILFILKESHILNGDDCTKQEKIQVDEQRKFYTNFFKEYTEENEMIYKIDKNNIIVPVAYANREKYHKYFDNRSKQKEKIARMARYIIDERITSNYSKLCEALKQVAFMNINKMGGTDRTKPQNLKLYYKKYKKFILKEIEILNPDIIVVMCGLDEFIEDLNKRGFKIIKMFHTAVRGKYLNLCNEKEIEYYKKYINSDLRENVRSLCKTMSNDIKISNKIYFSIYTVRKQHLI